MRSVCVFCSSSNEIAPEFFAAADELGEQIARKGLTLVFGGTSGGLMGEVARSAHRHGGCVVSVIPRPFLARRITYELANELVVTVDLRERKAEMEARADAFIALPGGYGTLEEVLEILTLKQLGLHNKPIILLNTGGFYDHLVQFFDRLHTERFTRPDHTRLYEVAPDAATAVALLGHVQPMVAAGLWA